MKMAMYRVIIESNGYRLLEYSADGDDWPYWLENRSGEGMGICESDLNEMFEKYFAENF